MRPANWIIGVTAFVLALLAGILNSQICIPCLAVVAGLGAGYVGGTTARPETSNLALRLGASAGAMSGVGLFLGQLIGGIIGAVLLGPQGAMESLRGFGFELPPQAVDPNTFYFSSAVCACAFALFNVAVMAAFGALGGLLRFQQSRGATPPPGAAV